MLLYVTKDHVQSPLSSSFRFFVSVSKMIKKRLLLFYFILFYLV